MLLQIGPFTGPIYDVADALYVIISGRVTSQARHIVGRFANPSDVTHAGVSLIVSGYGSYLFGAVTGASITGSNGSDEVAAIRTWALSNSNLQRQMQLKRVRNVAGLSDAALIIEYGRAASEIGLATEGADSRRANRAHEYLDELYREIRSRGSEVQDMLLGLMDHEDRYIGVHAAGHALEFRPALAIAVLEGIMPHKGFPAVIAANLLMLKRKGQLKFD